MSQPTGTNMSWEEPSIACEPWFEDLKAYLDDELPLARRRAIETHLSSCAACTKELRIMQAVQEELRADEESQAAPLKPELKSRILESANLPEVPAAAPPARSNTWELPQEPAKRYRNSPRWYEYGALASLLVLVVVGILTMTGGRIKNTFNTAASKIDTTTDSVSVPPASSPPMGGWPGSSSGAAPDEGEAAPPIQQPDNIDRYIPPRPVENWTGRIGDDKKFKDNSGRRIQRRAVVSVAVKDVEVASNAVESRVKESGGYVVSNALNTNEGDKKTANLEIKVPVTRFESVLRQISSLGDVRAKDISGQDITEQYVSAGARRNVLGDELAVRQAQLRELERRSTRANADDRIRLRAEVRRLRIETAEAKARLDWLRKTTDMSDISVILQQKPEDPKSVGFTQQVGNSGREAWASFTEAAKIPVTALIWIIAYSPFWIPALILWRRYGNSAKRDSAPQG